MYQMMEDNDDKLDKIIDEIVEAMCKQKGLKIAERHAKETAEEVLQTYNDWKNKYPARSNEALADHAKEI